MLKFRYLIFCLSAVLIASAAARAQGGFSYEKNTFIVYFECLGIYPGTSLKSGEKILYFSIGESPAVVKSDYVINAKEAEKRFDALGFGKVYADKPLWAEIGCVHSFRGGMPESLARMTPAPKESDSIGIAIRGLPADAWISSGKGESVPMKIKDNPYLELVRRLVTNDCYGPDSLIRVRKFPIRPGRAIIQLDIGKVKRLSPEQRKRKIEEEMRNKQSLYEKRAWPQEKKRVRREFEKKDFFESVEICRFFLDGKRVLKKTKISRTTGVEERVDVAPDLNGENWADTTDTAIGFISLNQGKDWDIVLAAVGWEGVYYSIQKLNGSAIRYEHSLYTYH
ncbi:MAG: hypothetical protein JSS81_28685 [Acidobacteria bacterium]|nr:hypothetical protein [Acidobacteriota bacterium]